MFQVVVPSVLVIAAMLVLVVMGHVMMGTIVGYIGMFVVLMGIALWILYDSTRERRRLFFERTAARLRRLVRLLRA